MAGVYSTRFILAANSSNVQYRAPAGKVAVAKFASAVNSTASTTKVYVALNGAGIWGADVPGANGAAAVALMVVFYPEDLLQMLTTGAAINMHLSGYLLTAGPSRAGGQLPNVGTLPGPLPRDWPDSECEDHE